jgi:aspartate aminotransferase
MKPSATLALTDKITELKARGETIIALNPGEPDFPTPDNVVEACIKALREGKTKYVNNTGILDLRKAICAKLKKDNNLDYEPADIIVSTGAKQAIFNAMMTLCDPGDEVIIPTPCWVSYMEIVKLTGAKPVLVPTDRENFMLDIPAIEKAISPKTKAVLINSPNNPTGAVYREKELSELAKLAVEHQFYVVSDEIYEKLVYEDSKHISIASLSKEVKPWCVTINGVSKAYSMTGFRLGYVAAEKALIKGMGSFQSHSTSNSTTFVQYAAIEALSGRTDAAVEKMREEFARRRSYMVGRLQKMKGIQCPNAHGAFYLFPNVSSYFGKSHQGKTIKDSNDFCNFMLENAHVAVVPGISFVGPGCVRISYAVAMDAIKTGLDAFEKALTLLQ